MRITCDQNRIQIASPPDRPPVLHVLMVLMVVGLALWHAWTLWDATYTDDWWVVLHGRRGSIRQSAWATKISDLVLAAGLAIVAAGGLVLLLRPTSRAVEVEPGRIRYEQRGLWARTMVWQGADTPGFTTYEVGRPPSAATWLALQTADGRVWPIGELTGNEPADLIDRLNRLNRPPAATAPRTSLYGWLALALAAFVLALLFLPHILADWR
jgi:hypothetical protein